MNSGLKQQKEEFFAPRSIVVVHGAVNASLFDILKAKKVKTVFVLEGRPTLENAKNSCRELLKRKMTPTVISDNSAGFLFYKNLVKEVWTAYQISDHNGALCDIGALILGVLAREHKVALYAYPTGRKTGFLAKPETLRCFNGQRVVSNNVKAYVPLMEWLPKKYIRMTYIEKAGKLVKENT